MTLITQFGCDTSMKGYNNQSVLHSACQGGNINLVRTLILEHNADLKAEDKDGNMPIHIAATNGREEVTMVLITEFGCDTNVKSFNGRSLLHHACQGGNVNLVQALIQDHIAYTMSPFDSDGDTPLHICSRMNHSECVTALLYTNAPIMIRNNAGKTPVDLAQDVFIEVIFNTYILENKEKIYNDYAIIQERAKKQYSVPACITRIFVVGNTGTGKSSLIESLNRDGFFASRRRVSVPAHTAGIIPTVYSSKIYGRVSFYDFAGDPEYYSSHAAIIENLASTCKGDNIFIIVVNLVDEIAKIKSELYYWASFIQHQKFQKTPFMILVGSHADKIPHSRDIEQKRSKFLNLCGTFQPDSKLTFMLNCCKPKSKKLKRILKLIRRLTEESPSYSLSAEESILLGLLDKDFENVVVCSSEDIINHIEATRVGLPTNLDQIRVLLQALHEIGLLFLIENKKGNNLQIVLNTSKLTNEVHQLLFSSEAVKSFKEKYNFKIGIVPKEILLKILPQYATPECLIQLQYCQEISHSKIKAFTPLAESDSAEDQTFLFFPALITASKSERVTQPDNTYSINWLAQCSKDYDYFPPRFLHVLLLRLVFRFSVSPDSVSVFAPNPYP